MRRSGREWRPWIGPISSMRLLVVDDSPPESSTSTPSSIRMAAQPPGPGLPLQAPSTYMWTGTALTISALASSLEASILARTAALSPEGERDQGCSPRSGRDHRLRKPVEVAAAGLAGEERRLGAQLLEPLGRDGHAAAAAQVGLDHLGEGEAAARLQELVVVGEHVGGKLLGQLGALRAHEREVGLDATELLLERGLLLLALALPRLEAALRLADVDGEALLALHEDEDLLLHPPLLLLDLFDLGEDGGVLLVGLHLVEAPLGLGALGLDHLEVFFAGALFLLGRVQAGSCRLHVLLGRLDGSVDGGDLLGQAGGLGLVGGDARIHALEVDEGLELGVHYAGLVASDPSPLTPPSPLRGEGGKMVGPLGLEPRPDRL